MDQFGKLSADKKQSLETRNSKVTPSMEEKESYHPPNVLRCESYSEKTRIQNIAVSGKQARCLAPISVS